MRSDAFERRRDVTFFEHGRKIREEIFRINTMA